MSRTVRTALLGSVLAVALSVSVTYSIADAPSDATAISSSASPSDPPVYDTAENAVDAFKTALSLDGFDKRDEVEDGRGR